MSEPIIESGGAATQLEVREYDPEVAGLEIAERFYQLVSAGSDGFVGYFMLSEQCHRDTEANFLLKLGLQKPDITNIQERQLLAEFGKIGLYLTPQRYDGSDEPIANHYMAERLPKQRKFFGLLKLF